MSQPFGVILPDVEVLLEDLANQIAFWKDYRQQVKSLGQRVGRFLAPSAAEWFSGKFILGTVSSFRWALSIFLNQLSNFNSWSFHLCLIRILCKAFPCIGLTLTRRSPMSLLTSWFRWEGRTAWLRLCTYLIPYRFSTSLLTCGSGPQDWSHILIYGYWRLRTGSPEAGQAIEFPCCECCLNLICICFHLPWCVKLWFNLFDKIGRAFDSAAICLEVRDRNLMWDQTASRCNRHSKLIAAATLKPFGQLGSIKSSFLVWRKL